MDSMFTMLKPGKGFYRSNWAVVPSGAISPHAPPSMIPSGEEDDGEYDDMGGGKEGDTEAGKKKKKKKKPTQHHHVYSFSRDGGNLDAPVFAIDPNADPADLFLRVEYEKERVDYILFSVATHTRTLRNKHLL
jgi:hypothetical protein